ncbi:hypothetical protein LS684_07195 [Cytobacillus spongiae]|jgi:hypothetical protein|uniref:hypothetical protein n=1 Tax=Cytobacillus spongiae TaxID=2901381 RepID=UPI001F1C1CBC|nr:hypothetical protein [Cytobacillus spongiae]UII57220.1 hypothetical protein LS684_07195 [Cytobacillus spongiae]
MKLDDRMDLIFIPTTTGLLKVQVTGFIRLGSLGKVFAELNGITATASGYHRKKTIIQSLTNLHTLILKNN